MGLLTRFIAVITCRSCSTVDEKVRNIFYRKISVIVEILF